MINFITNLFSKNRNRQRDVPAVAPSTVNPPDELVIKQTQDEPVSETQEVLQQVDVIRAKINNDEDVQLRPNDNDMIHLRQKAMPRDSGNFSVIETEKSQSMHLESINDTEQDVSECYSASEEIDLAMESKVSKNSEENEVLDLNSKAQTRYVSSFLSERRPERSSLDSVDSMDENKKLSNANSGVVDELLDNLNEVKYVSDSNEVPKKKLEASPSVEEYIIGHKFKQLEKEQNRNKFEEKKKRVSENLDEFLNIHSMNQLRRMNSSNGYEEIEYVEETNASQDHKNDLEYSIENDGPKIEEHFEERVESAPIDGYNEVLKMTQMLDKFVEEENVDAKSNLPNSDKEVEQTKERRKSKLTPSEELKSFVAKMPEICYKRERSMCEQLLKRHEAEVELKRFLTKHKANQLRRMQSVPTEVIKLEQFIDSHAHKTIERANSLRQVEESWSKAKDLLIPYLENYQHKVEETYNITIKEDEEVDMEEGECLQKEHELNNFKGELAQACKTTIDDVLQVTQRELEKTSVPPSPTGKKSDAQLSDEEDIVIDHSGVEPSISIHDVIGVDKDEISREELSQMCDDLSEIDMIDEVKDDEIIEKKVQFERELSPENDALEVDEIVKFRSTPYSEPYNDSEDQNITNNHIYENIAHESTNEQVLKTDEVTAAVVNQNTASLDTTKLNQEDVICEEIKPTTEMQEQSQVGDILASVEEETRFDKGSDENSTIVEQLIENQQAVITKVTVSDLVEQKPMENEIVSQESKDELKQPLELDEKRKNPNNLHEATEISQSDSTMEVSKVMESQKSIHEELADSLRKDELEEENCEEKAVLNSLENPDVHVDSIDVLRQETFEVDIIQASKKAEEIVSNNEKVIKNIPEIEAKLNVSDELNDLNQGNENTLSSSNEVLPANEQAEVNPFNNMTGSMITEIAEAPDINDNIVQIPVISRVQEIDYATSPYEVITEYINSQPLETNSRSDEMNVSMITQVSELPDVENNQSDIDVSDNLTNNLSEEKEELTKMKSIHEEMAEVNEIQPLDNQFENHHWEGKASRDDLTLGLNDNSQELLDCQVILESTKGVVLHLGSKDESKLPEKLENKMKRTLSHEKSVEEIECKLNRAESRRKEYRKHSIKHAVNDLERCQRLKNIRVPAE